MRLERLEVVDFRNHDAAAVELPAGVSALVGPNGVGKTNLLEAVGYLATLARTGSARTRPDPCRAASAVIRAAVRRAGRRLLVDVELRPGSGVRGRVQRGAGAAGPGPARRGPGDAVRARGPGLVRGDPEERRRFLDTLATQRLPRYHGSRQDYDRVLRQRNTLLRSAGGRLPAAALATLEVWDEKLASAGAEIWSERLRLVAALTPGSSSPTSAWPGGRRGRRRLRVVGRRAGAADPDPAKLAQALRERLVADRAREVERGITLSGPHRDDLALGLRGLPARTHASHGEAWSLALALRLGSHRLLSEEGEEPVLLMDDVFAELDGNDGIGSRRRPWPRSRPSSRQRWPRSYHPSLARPCFTWNQDQCSSGRVHDPNRGGSGGPDHRWSADRGVGDEQRDGMTRRSREPRPIGGRAGRRAPARGWDGRLAAARVVARWPEVVGDAVAAHCQPSRLEEDGTLHVVADSAAWATQLTTSRASSSTASAPSAAPASSAASRSAPTRVVRAADRSRTTAPGRRVAGATPL
jgi:DNA replication and repair protein RecF